MRVQRTETKTIQRDVLRLTSTLVIGGELLPPGAFVEVDDIDAEGLIARRVAVRACADEIASAEVTSAPRSRITRM